MTHLSFLILCGGYGFFTWAAGRRRPFAEAALCFLDGGYLAMLCFAILPLAMETPFFYGAALLSALGIVAGLLLERKFAGRCLSAVLFMALTVFYFRQGKVEGMGKALVLAFFGGMGLYHACAGILPEPILSKDRIAGALLSGGGFLLGTVYFAELL